MKTKQCIFVTVLILLFAATPNAFGEVGAYMALKGVYTNQQVSDPGIAYSSDQWGFDDKDDWVNGFGVALGFDFSRMLDMGLRVELEYVSREASDVSWSGDDGIWDDGDVNWEVAFENELNTLMLNFYYDFDSILLFTPYVSLGVGSATMDWNSSYIDDIGTSDVTMEDDSSELVWSLGVGGSIALSKALAIDLGYRYVDLGEFEAANYSVSSTAEFNLNELVLGLRFTF
jgi:opacity protein-like surface antigen